MLLGSVHHSFLYKPVLIPPADPFIHYYCRSLCLFSLSFSLFLSFRSTPEYEPFIPQSTLPFLILDSLTLTLTLNFFLSQFVSRVYPPLPYLPLFPGLFFSSLDGPLQSAFLTSCSLIHRPSHLPHHLHPPLLSLPPVPLPGLFFRPVTKENNKIIKLRKKNTKKDAVGSRQISQADIFSFLAGLQQRLGFFFPCFSRLQVLPRSGPPGCFSSSQRLSSDENRFSAKSR